MEEIVVREKSSMTEEEFLSFIEKEIETYRKHVNFEAKVDISFFELQEKLKEYSNVSLTLVYLSTRYRFQLKSLQRIFNSWFDKKVIDIQTVRNRLDIAKTKWLSTAELERIARVENAEEYSKRIEELDGLEAREKFINLLLKEWEMHSYILKNISDNIRSEVNNLGLEKKLSH